MKVRPRLSYANIVSTLCLFLVLGGVAYAAGLAPGSVGTKQLKNGAVTSVKIKNGAVTGAKVNLSSLGTVPSASHAASADTAATATHAGSADTATSAGSAATAARATNADEATHATDSDRLGGEPPSSFFRSADVKPFRFFANYCVSAADPSCTAAPLLTIEETKLEATCQFTGGEAQLQVTLTTNNTCSLSYNYREGSTVVPVETYGGGAFGLHVLTMKASTNGKTAGGTLVLDNNNSPISIDFLLSVGANFSNEGLCQFTGTALHAA